MAHTEDGFPNQEGFAWRDLHGEDRWESFSPSFVLTLVGDPTYVGRVRRVGAQVFFQVKFSAVTSIASTAGTSYLTLPITAKSQGITGVSTMTNDTTNIAVGVCHIDVANSRCYLPAQVASGNTFVVSGWYEA